MNKDHENEFHSSQRNLPEVFIDEGLYGASLRAREGVGTNGNTILARDYVDPRAEEYVRRANVYSELVEALETAFVALGWAGANGDVKHSQRAAWEKARAVLSKAKP